MLNFLITILNQQEGQGMAEYAFILALVVLATIAGFRTLGSAVSGKIDGVASSF